MHKINVGWMFPNLLNLHGERGSVQALVAIGKNLGIEVVIHRIEDMDSPIPYKDLDLLLILPGEIAELERLIPVLNCSDLTDYVQQDGYLLAIGTSGLMFGKSILREDGSTVNGLGLLDMTAKERQYVWGDDLHVRLNDTMQELVGSQIMMADVTAENPLGETLYGMGNNSTGSEGARWKNLIYTNCLGPLFVKNPWFAESILKDILLQKLGVFPRKKQTIACNSFHSTLRFIRSTQEK